MNSKKRERDIYENNNSSCNNNSNNNNEYKIKLYNSVFNNKYLKRIIFNHLKIFNIFLAVKKEFKTIEEWNLFKYKEYLFTVEFEFDNVDFDLNELPENIKHISMKSPYYVNSHEIIQVPLHIESVIYTNTMRNNIKFQQLPHSSKINTLSVNWLLHDEIPMNLFPKSLQNLNIRVSKLSRNVLPESIKYLSIYGLELFEKGFLTCNSLTSINIQLSTPSFINEIFKAKAINLIKLCYSNYRETIDSCIQFPNTLQELVIRCDSFYAKLPVSLKSLSLSFKSLSQTPIHFPPSLKHLSLSNILYDGINQEMVQSCRSQTPNLKSLVINYSKFTDQNDQSIFSERLETLKVLGENLDYYQMNFTRLPSSLKKLSFEYSSAINHSILFNEIMPSNLTHLNLGISFNQVIDVNVLPAGLEILCLGNKYSQIINPLAIPKQLKSLQIYNSFYPHSINLTLTHPNTLIDSNNNIDFYYNALSPEYDQIHVLRLPNCFESSLSALKLQNKSNLEYLHLGHTFNHEIQLSDLPIQNNIKTLELSYHFEYTINLEYFQNLETIIISKLFSSPTITTTTTTIIDAQNQQQVYFNNYKLKRIIVSPNSQSNSCNSFYKNLDINFYQFLEYNQNKSSNKQNNINH